MAALRKNRVNHAYLFSGPRGCGKTTSARILARCLNCAQGPTDTPCGQCDSCRELGRGGPGSLDVIEIDAASHGGVDDARDLRERATFAPVRDRYKIFIIDEAHMVTSAGFNALLKIVEEPPEHIKFIFATTEPDKVIGTIRSRTHHYPFRLVPPEPLIKYLELLCRQENVPVAPGVLSLVIRAGGGSVRDSLSVLDQLMAGAGPDGLDYDLAVSLLGYTHASLLDDVVDAITAADSATVFRAVDRVIQTGHDPRRFVEDLLERFRDLIIINAMPESAAAILRGTPEDQISRMRQQSMQLGASELSRAADITNTALTEMTGATSPRLHLELLCARIMLPAADQTERGIASRVDRIERRLSYAGAPSAPAGAEPVAADAASAAGTAPTEAAAGAGAEFAVPAASGPAAARAAARGMSQPAAGSGTPERAAGSGAAEPAAARRDRFPSPRVSTDDWPREDGVPAQTSVRQAVPSGQSAPSGQEAERSHDAWPAMAAQEQRAEQRPEQRDDRPQRPAVAPPAAVPSAPIPSAPVPAAEEPNPSDWGGTWGAPAPEPSTADASSTITSATEAPAAETPTVQQRPQPEIRADERPGAGQPQQAEPTQLAQSAQQPAGTGGGSQSIEMFRRAWPEIMEELARIKRSTWSLVQPNASVQAFDGGALGLGFTTEGLANAFFGRKDHIENVRAAVQKTLGADVRIVRSDSSPAAGEPDPKGSSRPAPAAVTGGWGTAAAEPALPAGEPQAVPSVPPAPPTPGPATAVRPAQTPPASNPPAPMPPSSQAPAARPAPARQETRPAAGSRAATSADTWQWTDQVPPEPDYPDQEPPVDYGDPTEAEVSWDQSEPSAAPAAAPTSPPEATAPPSDKPLSRYQLLKAQAAAQARTQGAAPMGSDRRNLDLSYIEDIPSADDETIEESGLVGRAAIERILGGRLIEERNLDGM